MENYLNKKILGLFVKTKGVISKPFFSGMGHILCFHRIKPQSSALRIKGNSGMEVSPEFMEKTIGFFKDKNYEFISIDRLYDILLNKIKPEKKFIVLTLDDGYSDNYNYAYPIFKKNDIPFTIYITTDFPDRKAVLWWYLLEDLLKESNTIKFSFLNKDYCFDCSVIEQKEQAFLEIRSLILENKINKEKLFSMIFPDFEKKNQNLLEQNALSWEQIIELSRDDLVTIGAHTVSHRPLSRLNEIEALSEIKWSKERLETQIKKPVNHFAYPYGGADTCSEREFVIVKQAGYKTATTLRQGNIFKGYKDFTERLPRIALGENSDKEKIIHITNGIHHFSTNYFNRIIIK
jgi:peptidoglycan/xylan/chitin deacetylase (PgdA/CDA1 family)